jgi:hypothetical protein
MSSDGANPYQFFVIVIFNTIAYYGIKSPFKVIVMIHIGNEIVS